MLVSALEAVDRLNSWVRSPSFRVGISSGSLRRMIYHLKRQAIERAQVELPCRHTPFIVQVKCRDCAGSGRYTDWNGYTWPHCRDCNSTGTATLYFVETKIGDLLTWHSPTKFFPLPPSVLVSNGDPGKTWTVNQPGRDLAPDEAAGFLNIAHEIFRKDAPTHYSYFCDDEYFDNDNLYSLWIGEDVDACAHCASTEALKRCGKRVGRVEFTFACCKDCRGRLTTEQQFSVTIPKRLFKLPNINTWIVRQNALHKPTDRSERNSPCSPTSVPAN